MGNKFVTILMMYTIIHASLLKDNVINVHAACLCGRFPVGYFSSKYDWLRPDIHLLAMASCDPRLLRRMDFCREH